MTRRQPLQYDVENLRDLVESEPATKPQENSGGILQKPLRQTHDRLEQVFDLNAIWVRRYAIIKQRGGPSDVDVRDFVSEYGNKTPQERMEWLAEIQMSPREMAGFFKAVPKAPELPEADPVLIYCNRNGEDERERQSATRSIALDSIVTGKDSLWPRAVAIFTNQGIRTLGELSDADPRKLSSVKNYGPKLQLLAGRVLQTYRLLTPAWVEYLKTLQEN